MMFSLTPPRRFDPRVRERMDEPGNDPRLLREDLGVLATINRCLGGHQIPLHYLHQLGRSDLHILDLATGASTFSSWLTAGAGSRKTLPSVPSFASIA